MNSSNRRRFSNAPTSPKEGRLRNRQTSISQPGNQLSPISLTGAVSQTQAERDPYDMDIADLEKSMSALRFVPTSVTRNQRKPGSRPWYIDENENAWWSNKNLNFLNKPINIDGREVKVALKGPINSITPPRITVPSPPVESAVQCFYIKDKQEIIDMGIQ